MNSLLLGKLLSRLRWTHSTITGDATVAYTSPNTCTLTMSTGITTPTTDKLVAVFVDTGNDILEWVNGVNCRLSIAGLVVTISQTPNVYPIPSAACTLKVFWADTPRGWEYNCSAWQHIDIAHERIHDGKAFFVSDISPELDTTTYYWKVTTPDTAVRAHFTLELSSNVATNGYLYENPTVNVAGAAMTEYNADRNSATATTIAVTKGDTSTADGTLLWSATFGGTGTGPTRIGGSTASREELILKQNEDYFIKVTTLANDGFVNLRASWYEL